MDIFRKALAERMKKVDKADSETAPTKVEGPLNTHKKTMSQYEFGNSEKKKEQRK